MTERHRARMVPELLVSDLSRSLAFWMDLCGFEIVYRREDEGFVYLDLEGAQFMLEEVRGDDNWITAPLEGPRGRGINFEITVRAVEPLLERLAAAGWPLYREQQERWYRSDAIEIGVRQFLVRIRTAICCDSRSGSANGRLTGRPASGHGKPAACLKTAGPDLSPPQAPSEALRQRLGGIAGRLALIDRVGQFRDEPGSTSLVPLSDSPMRRPSREAAGAARLAARRRSAPRRAWASGEPRARRARRRPPSRRARRRRVCIRCKVGMMGILCKREKSVAAARAPARPGHD